MSNIIGLATSTRPSTTIFGSSPIVLDQPIYSVPGLEDLLTCRSRFGPPVKRRDPRPVALRLDAEDVNEQTWRQLKIIAWKPNEEICEVSLLRPLWWIAETGAKAGGLIHLAMTDFGLEGPAKVLAINPCPKIESGRGQVVTGKFKHWANFLLAIHFVGSDTPLEVTPNHPIFSLDRNEFVKAGMLRVGERLKSRASTPAVVERIGVKHGKVPVYNLEVHRDHTFLVTKLGILVHNSYEINFKQETEIDQYLESKGMTAVKNPNESQGSGDRLVNGLPTEYKTVNGVQNPTLDSISGAISNRAMNARSQAPNVVIDIRGQAGATEEAAVKGAVRAYGADKKVAADAGTTPKILSIRVIFKNALGIDTDQIFYPPSN